MTKAIFDSFVKCANTLRFVLSQKPEDSPFSFASEHNDDALKIKPAKTLFAIRFILFSFAIAP